MFWLLFCSSFLQELIWNAMANANRFITVMNLIFFMILLSFNFLRLSKGQFDNSKDVHDGLTQLRRWRYYFCKTFGCIDLNKFKAVIFGNNCVQVFKNFIFAYDKINIFCWD